MYVETVCEKFQMHVVYRVDQAECVILALVAAPQEYVNISSTRKSVSACELSVCVCLWCVLTLCVEQVLTYSCGAATKIRIPRSAWLTLYRTCIRTCAMLIYSQPMLKGGDGVFDCEAVVASLTVLFVCVFVCGFVRVVSEC